MESSELAKRAAEIRLSHKAISEQSGIYEDTVGRTLREDTDPRGSTIRGIQDAIIAEEKKLLAYLIQLHPDAAIQILSEPKPPALKFSEAVASC